MLGGSEVLHRITSPQENLVISSATSTTAIPTPPPDEAEISLHDLELYSHLNSKDYASAGSIYMHRKMGHHLFAVKEMSLSSIQEFIAAALVKRVLQSRAPDVHLVTNFGIASKFFRQSSFSNSLKDYETLNGNLNYVFREYSDIEIILSVLMRFGDIDAYPRNILTGKLNTTQGVQKRLLKIDHGWGLTTFFTNEGEMRQVFFKRFSAYVPYINLNKLRTAISECCSVSDEEIVEIAKRRVYLLKQQKNVKPPFEFQIGIDDELAPDNTSSFYSTIQFLTLDEYASFILKRLKKQGEVLRKCIRSLYLIWIIEKNTVLTGIDRVNLFCSLDPLVWALQNDIRLGGLDTLTFIREMKLMNSYVLIYLINRNQYTLNELREYLHPPKEIIDDALIIYCLDNDYNIHDIDPLTYAAENNLITEELARYAAENGLRIGGLDAFDYGVQHGMLFKGLHPIVYALTVDLEVDDQVESLKIDNQHPLKFWDIEKKGHFHNSIFLEIITNDKHLALWTREDLQSKMIEVAKFVLFHGLQIYERDAVDFLDSIAFSIHGLDPDIWASQNCNRANKPSLRVNIGVASQIGI